MSFNIFTIADFYHILISSIISASLPRLRLTISRPATIVFTTDKMSRRHFSASAAPRQPSATISALMFSPLSALRYCLPHIFQQPLSSLAAFAGFRRFHSALRRLRAPPSPAGYFLAPAFFRDFLPPSRQRRRQPRVSELSPCFGQQPRRASLIEAAITPR